jgi:glutaminyl-tRNA synthetase
MSEPEKITTSNFIYQIIDTDIKNKKNTAIITRFPPEPNGYLHIGHAKSICLNFLIAQKYQGKCNLRFDDTNPAKESNEYVESIVDNIKWLGFEWNGEIHYSSDYFEQLYRYALELIQASKAYVDDSSTEDIRLYRGDLTHVGKNSPFRDRSVEENTDLFQRMRAGEFADGAKVLRAKIDMASPNMNLRDPLIYRIKRATHIRTGDTWCIYPLYDFTHCISDAIEGITHSICTLEFEDHRPLYDWVLDNISIECHPQQIEFSRLNLEHTIMSKRLLNTLVTENKIDGWDDPRMPTVSGLRRRGVPAIAIREFAERIGVTKKATVIEMGVLESCIREELDANAPRAMAVLNPLKVIISNYPEDKIEQLVAKNHPKNPEMGQRNVPLTKEIYIDQADFRESANKKYKRLVLGGEVRLRNAYVIKCEDFTQDDQGNITELRCTYDDQTLGKNPEGRKVRGVIHWVSASLSEPAEVRVYDRLFNVANPSNEDFINQLNPESIEILTHCRVEKNLKQATSEQRFQFEREGYYCVDNRDSSPEHLVFNKIVSLRDTWAKIEKKT